MDSRVENLVYQLVVLGPASKSYHDHIGPGLYSSFKKLGLDPEVDFEVIEPGKPGGKAIDWRGSPVGVWFGDETSAAQEELEVLGHLQEVGAPVLPLVEDLNEFSKRVPDRLIPINGRQWADPRITDDILRAFRLTRELRQAFISYRRAESQRVAEDLFDALSRRGFHIFLDTASVAATEKFQDVLWDRMADMDMIVLLDTPNALTSRWVNDELVRVNHLGLGVLQLVWPGHVPARETDLSTRCLLAAPDFVNNDHGPEGRLKSETLDKVISLAEFVRIESLAARRRRVVGEFVALVPSTLRIEVQPVGPLVIRPASGVADDDPLGVILPVVGLPDARLLHRENMELDQFRLRIHGVDEETVSELVRQGKARVLYDGLGVRGEHSQHLIWLNSYLPLRTFPIDRLPETVAGTSDDLIQWLEGLIATQPAEGSSP